MKYLVFLILLVSYFSFGQQLEPFQLYSKKGRKVSFKKLIRKVEDTQVILFGELHNNSIAHYIQLRLIQELDKKHDLTLGAEMLEADNQKALNAYLSDSINQEGLDSIARLWGNYHTDYKPLVDFAKENKIPFIATNIPRKFASEVYRNGLESLNEILTESEAKWVAPLPIAYDPELPSYKKMLSMMGGDHENPNFPKAQAIKDATMAYFIEQALQKYESQLVHFNGDFHSKNFEGIYWYLKHRNKGLSIITISTVEQKDVSKLEEKYEGQADFILVVDEEMTKTYQ